MRPSDSAEHSSNQSRPHCPIFGFCWQKQHIRPESRHARIVFGQCKDQNHQPRIFNINTAYACKCIVCMLAFFGLEMSNPPTSVFFTCSSNRLMMAWTHSTGLCAAMLRRMRSPLCLLSITSAIPIPAPDSPRMRQIPPKPLRKIIKEENRGGGGRRGVWFSFSLQAYSTTPP